MWTYAVVLPLTAEWAGSVVIDLPSAKTEIHESVMPEILRVMSKGANISITHRDKAADTKSWVDRLVMYYKSKFSLVFNPALQRMFACPP